METAAAEIVMTFIQLARDEFGMFQNEAEIKSSTRSYEKLTIRENLATIYRNIKNRMTTNASDYEKLLEIIADNADMLEDDLQRIHAEFLNGIKQSMRYDYQKPFMHATMTYVFVFTATRALDLYMHVKHSPQLEETMQLLDKLPRVYGWEAWKPLNEFMKPEWCAMLIEKVVLHVISKYKIPEPKVACTTPKMRQFDMKSMCDKLINKAI